MLQTRTNQEWLQALNASGALQEGAVEDLRDLLLRAALVFFNRNLSDFGGLSQNEILHLAEDCAQDALIAVMKRLPDFRGDSKFTTWAYKFSINHALMAARHERVRGISLDELTSSGESNYLDWLVEDVSDGSAPEESMMRAEIRRVIRDVIDRELTDKQRAVLFMIIFNDAPMDEVVQHMGSNRNAIYKMLHDARKKLKNGLQIRGFDIHETLDLFAVRE